MSCVLCVWLFCFCLGLLKQEDTFEVNVMCWQEEFSIEDRPVILCHKLWICDTLCQIKEISRIWYCLPQICDGCTQQEDYCQIKFSQFFNIPAQLLPEMSHIESFQLRFFNHEWTTNYSVRKSRGTTIFSRESLLLQGTPYSGARRIHRQLRSMFLAECAHVRRMMSALYVGLRPTVGLKTKNK